MGFHEWVSVLADLYVAAKEVRAREREVNKRVKAEPFDVMAWGDAVYRLTDARVVFDKALDNATRVAEPGARG